MGKGEEIVFALKNINFQKDYNFFLRPREGEKSHRKKEYGEKIKNKKRGEVREKKQKKGRKKLIHQKFPFPHLSPYRGRGVVRMFAFLPFCFDVAFFF